MAIAQFIRTLLEGYAAGLLLAAIATAFATATRIGPDLLETLASMFNPLPSIALLPLAMLVSSSCSFMPSCGLKLLSNAVDRLADAYQSLDVARTLTMKQSLYDILFDGAGNPMIGSVLRPLNDRITMLRQPTLSSPKRSKQSIREIRTLMAAIKRPDGSAAYEISMHHIHQAGKVALKALEERSSS